MLYLTSTLCYHINLFRYECETLRFTVCWSVPICLFLVSILEKYGPVSAHSPITLDTPCLARQSHILVSTNYAGRFACLAAFEIIGFYTTCPEPSLALSAVLIYLSATLWDLCECTDEAAIELYFSRLHTSVLQQGLNRIASLQAVLWVLITDMDSFVLQCPE